MHPTHSAVESADLRVALRAAQHFNFLFTAQFSGLFEFLGRPVDEDVGVVRAALRVAHRAGVRGSCGSHKKAKD